MKQKITCPKCAHTFQLDQAFNRVMEVEIRERISAEFEKKQVTLRKRLEGEASQKAAQTLTELQVKLAAQTKELRQAREQERALLRTKAELQDQAEKAELEAERTLSQERERIRRTAQQQLIEEHQLRDAEKNKQLEDLRRQIDDLKHKAEQGSQQLQGDIQELELEQALRAHFPKDRIETIKTGVRGADILHTVVSDDGKVCGTILWESKRVRHWKDDFVEKLLRDKSEAQADIAAIVTNVLPDHLAHMGSVRGVLLTTFGLAICLATTLRVNLALLGHTRLALSGQQDQKTRLFEYFMSPQFHEKMSMIAEQLHQMQSDLRKEKASLARSWSKREAQIETILFGTAGLTGALQAFCPALPPMPQFDLPFLEDETIPRTDAPDI
jgi:hypothetical protein